MNIIELGTSNTAHWWLVLEVGAPFLVASILLGFVVRRYWTPERRREYKKGIRRRLVGGIV